MIQWKYIKDACLAKLDLEEEEEIGQTLSGRFYIYANEAMSQVCSVFPNRTYVSFEVTEDIVCVPQKMPENFISFRSDKTYFVCKRRRHPVMEGGFRDPEYCSIPATENDFEYVGYNQVIFKHRGTFYIPYNALWYEFDANLNESSEITAPRAVVDCIVPYIVAQCFKVDDDYKASVFMNEFETALARIDDTDYSQNDTFHIRGNW